MQQVPITDLKNRLSEFLRLVKRGETIEIIERNVAIARIEAIEPASDSSSSRFQQLVREGAITRPKAPLDLRKLGIRPRPCQGDAVQAVIDERGDR
ncbi:MAG: type II toxin-antitoxin system prevent-host-death family antitoxin [Planctomycetes bacterium]|nr:type II toxin-antitoxin system prevent-host-death family antitoxin [Planctomycetota bacterium]